MSSIRIVQIIRTSADFPSSLNVQRLLYLHCLHIILIQRSSWNDFQNPLKEINPRSLESLTRNQEFFFHVCQDPLNSIYLSAYEIDSKQIFAISPNNFPGLGATFLLAQLGAINAKWKASRGR